MRAPGFGTRIVCVVLTSSGRSSATTRHSSPSSNTSTRPQLSEAPGPAKHVFIVRRHTECRFGSCVVVSGRPGGAPASARGSGGRAAGVGGQPRRRREGGQPAAPARRRRRTRRKGRDPGRAGGVREVDPRRCARALGASLCHRRDRSRRATPPERLFRIPSRSRSTRRNIASGSSRRRRFVPMRLRHQVATPASSCS